LYLLSFAQKREKKRNETKSLFGLERFERESKSSKSYSAFFDAFVRTFIKA
jgi:hypothetical protein